MGYTTQFEGRFTLDKALTVPQLNYLTAFADTRRFRRSAAFVETLPDPFRLAVGLPVGKEGGYYVGGRESADGDYLNYNTPPEGQPGLWCKWCPSADGQGVEWDGGEKFYAYVEWLQYLIEHFLKPWGHVLNGEVTWAGEEPGDLGRIVVTDNVVLVQQGRVIYDAPLTSPGGA